MACSTVLLSELKNTDVVIWFGKYRGFEPWTKFMLHKTSKYEHVYNRSREDNVFFGVIRNGVFHYVEK